jgi:poly(3-hydroxybutyrate) depolymerase
MLLLVVAGACGGRGPLGGPTGAAGASGGSGGITAGSAGAMGGAGGAATGGTGGGGGAGTSGTAGAAGATGAGATVPDGAAGATDASGAADVSASVDGGGTDVVEAEVMPPRGGCVVPPPPVDSSTRFAQHIVDLTGKVDLAFVAAHPANAGTQFNWLRRNYYLRLPQNYDFSKAYPLTLEGTGCGGGETTGSSGEYSVPRGSSASAVQSEAIQIGLSYVDSSSATPSCPMFATDYVDSPEPAYLRAVINDVEQKYCVDPSRIFINGYETGALLANLASCTNPDEIRGIGIQIGGGLEMQRPPCMAKPVAAMFVVGLLDLGYPIGPLATPQNDTIGSVAARDELLHRNGCVAPDFQIVDTCSAGANLPCTTGVADGDTYSNVPHQIWNPTYPKCQMYTGCPAKYPVVWCPLSVNHGNGPNPMGTDGALVNTYRFQGLWDFYKSLPPP